MNSNIDENVKSAIVAKVPKDRLGYFSVSEGEDSTSEKALFVDIFLVNSLGGYGGEIHREVTTAVRSALEDIGENRYPHVRFRYEMAIA